MRQGLLGGCEPLSSGTMSEPRRSRASDFSIDRILARDDEPKQRRACASFSDTPADRLHWLGNLRPEQQLLKDEKCLVDRVCPDSTESVKKNNDSQSGNFNSEKLSWLRCTRYCPPKLPRKSCTGKNLKRKPGSQPRIPFTKYQLDVLEDKYKSSAYLSKNDVVSLSDLLNLPQSKIKIWFQNRRARERRESQKVEQTHSTSV